MTYRAPQHSTLTRALLLALIGLVQAPLVLAQDAASGEEETTTLDQITVTAQKREEALQDVPVVVTALTEAMLECLRTTLPKPVWSIWSEHSPMSYRRKAFVSTPCAPVGSTPRSTNHSGPSSAIQAKQRQTSRPRFRSVARVTRVKSRMLLHFFAPREPGTSPARPSSLMAAT